MVGSRSKKVARRTQNAQVSKALLGDFYPEDAHAYRVDRHSFTIFVGGDPAHAGVMENVGAEPGVEHNMADRFEINLNMLSGIDSEKPILINLSSCGGNWEHGMKMFGAILYCPNPVTVLATYDARSMTSLIPLAADRFLIRPPAQYMFHQGTFGFEGTVAEAITAGGELAKSSEMMLRIYIARLKSQGMYKSRPEAEIRKILIDHMKDHVDVWLSADDALRWGFADATFEGNLKTLRATKVNSERRKMMSTVIRKKLRVEAPRVF